MASEKSYSYNDLGGLHILILFEYSDGSVLAKDGILSDEDFLNLLLRRGIIHNIQHHVFKDGTQSPSAGFLVKGFPCDRSECAFRELELHLLEGEQFLILFRERVSRLGQDSNEGAFIQLIQGSDDRQPTDEFRDQAVLEESLPAELSRTVRQVALRSVRELQLRIPSPSDSGVAR